LLFAPTFVYLVVWTTAIHIKSYW